MAKIQSNAKRVLAIVLSLMMVFGACFTGMVTASAESLADGLTAVATSATDGGNYNGFNGFRTITDLPGGGITYASTGAGARSPYVHNVATSIPGNGVVLQFDGYSSDPTDEKAPTSYGYRSIMIVLGTCPTGTNADRANYRLAQNNAGIVIDTANGAVKYVKGNDSTYIGPFTTVKWIVQDSDVVKYANIANKPFTVALNPAADGAIEVVVTVNGTDSVSGIITAEEYASIANATTANITFGICAVEGGQDKNIQPMTINYYGYKKVAGPSLADGLTAVATTTTQGCNTINSNASVFTDIEGGGVTISTKGHGAYRPYLHNFGVPQFPNGGVTLQFDNFVSTSPESHAGVRGYRSFMIVLSNSPTDDEACRLRSDAVPAFVIDTYNGNVDFVKGVDASQTKHTVVQRVIENNDTIKYSNIAGKAFTITFNYNKDGDITVDVAVDNAVASGVLDANKFASVVNTNAKLTYFSISAVDNGAQDAEGNSAPEANSFNYYGYKTLDLAPAFLSDLTSVASYDTSRGYFKDNTHWGATTQAGVQYGMVGALSGGGVYIDVFQQAGYGSLQFPDNLGGYNGNFELLFGDYRATGTAAEEGYGQIGFVLQNAADKGNSSVYANSIIVGLDTITGTLALMQAKVRDNRTKDQVVTLATIATDDALKMENFQGKLFKLRWTQSADGKNIDVAIVMKDKTVSGTFAKSLLSTIQDSTQPNESLNATNAYLALSNIYGVTSNGGAYELFINYYGVNKNVDPPYILEARAQAQALTDNYYSSADSVYYNNQLTVTDLQDADGNAAGTTMKFTYGGYNPFVTKNSLGEFPAFTQGGYEFVFANYVDNSDTTSSAYHTLYFQFVAGLAGGEYYLAKSNQRGIVIDANTGTIKFTASYDEGCRAQYMVTLGEIVQSDALKYENITGKVFTVKFTNSTREGAQQYETKLDVTIYEADGSSVVVTGYIPYSYITADISSHVPADFTNYVPTKQNYFPTNGSGSYLCFSPWGNASSNVTIDFIGYNELAPEYMEEARNSVETLVTSANNKYSDSASCITDLKDGGVHYSAIGHWPFQLDQGMDCWPGNGFKLQFANYAELSDKTTAVGYRQFVVFFNWGLGNNTNYGPYWKGGNVGLNIDAVEGQLELVKSDLATLGNTQKYVQKVLIEDEMFLYENFAGTAFSYEILPAGYNNAAIINIKVGNKVRTCVIGFDEFVSVPEGFGTSTAFYPTATFDEKASKCDVSFSALLHDGTTAAVDFIGYTKYAAGNLTVGSTNAVAFESASVPVSVTTEAAQTMTIEVKADAAITGIVAADGVQIETVIDGSTALVNVISAVSGTDVKLFDVQLVPGNEKLIYTVAANVVADADGNKPAIRGSKGGVVVAEIKPDITAVKKQATEGAYKLGTLGFGTDTTALMAAVSDNFVAIEFGTVFFTEKMLGAQELVIGTKAVSGTASAITVSKSLKSNEVVPTEFVAILKDKASNTGAAVSDGYANTTFVARSFVKFMDVDTGAIFIVYGTTLSAKLANMQ